MRWWALIPARAGSSLQGKNRMTIGGRTLAQRAVDAVPDCIEKVVLSTDDSELAQTVTGCEISRRPAYLAQDHSDVQDVWLHEWPEGYEAGVLLEPTSPNRIEDDVLQCMEAVERGGYRASGTVTEHRRYDPSRTFLVRDRALFRIQPIGLLEGPFYRLNGCCYAAHWQAVVHRSLFAQMKAVVLHRPVANVDTLTDLEFARYLLALEAPE